MQNNTLTSRSHGFAALPAGVMAANVLQHFGLAAVTLAIPRLVAQAAGADAVMVENYCQLAMIALGVATLLQAWGRHGIGSGFLLPACYSGIYLASALVTAKAHGLGAVAGVTIVAGVTQIVLSRFLRHLRSFIPADVIGVGILMIGLGWGILGLKLLCGVGPGQTSPELEWIAGVAALATMVVASVWGSKSVRPLAVLIGLSAGCIAMFLLYMAFGDRALELPARAIVWPRWPLFQISFEDSLLHGFMIGGFASFLRATGDIIASHQVSDLNWKRPNTKTVAAGTLAEGLGNNFSGIIGSMPVNTSSGSVGLVAASGLSSRTVAYGVGFLWIAMGLLPFGASLLLLIPETVQGAAVFYTGGFVMRAGFSMLTQRAIDNRRAITIGSALILGLSFDDMMHALNISPAVKTVFSSALLASVATAILLTALFRIGVKQSISTTWEVQEGDARLRQWIVANGKLWAARSDVIRKAEAVLEEFTQAFPHLTKAPVAITASYDETSLRLEATWKGASAVSESTIAGFADLDAEDGRAALHLAMTLIRRVTDHVSEASLPGGYQRLTVVIDDL